MPLSEKDKKRRAQKRRNKKRSTSGREKDLEKNVPINYHAAKNGKKQLERHTAAEDNKGTGTSHPSTKWNQFEPAQFEFLPGKVSL